MTTTEKSVTPVSIAVHRAWGEPVEGQALVIKEGFSPRYDLNRWTGVISRIGHSAEGENIRGKILVFPTAKGGVAAGWAFLDLVEKGIAPKAFVFGVLNPVMVQGAILAGIPITDGWDQDAMSMIASGQTVRVDPSERVITVIG